VLQDFTSYQIIHLLQRNLHLQTTLPPGFPSKSVYPHDNVQPVASMLQLSGHSACFSFGKSIIMMLMPATFLQDAGKPRQMNGSRAM
jgi:hypothetical protein